MLVVVVWFIIKIEIAWAGSGGIDNGVVIMEMLMIAVMVVVMMIVMLMVVVIKIVVIMVVMMIIAVIVEVMYCPGGIDTLKEYNYLHNTRKYNFT